MGVPWSRSSPKLVTPLHSSLSSKAKNTKPRSLWNFFKSTPEPISPHLHLNKAINSDTEHLYHNLISKHHDFITGHLKLQKPQGSLVVPRKTSLNSEQINQLSKFYGQNFKPTIVMTPNQKTYQLLIPKPTEINTGPVKWRAEKSLLLNIK